jgi:hypothetical protein
MNLRVETEAPFELVNPLFVAVGALAVRQGSNDCIILLDNPAGAVIHQVHNLELFTKASLSVEGRTTCHRLATFWHFVLDVKGAGCPRDEKRCFSLSVLDTYTYIYIYLYI